MLRSIALMARRCRRSFRTALSSVTALDQIIAYFEGKPFNAKAQTKPILITKENVDDPNFWGNSFR
jgi:hypothetical protein